MKILIVGALGMLAQDVIRELDGTHQLVQRDLPEMDIREAGHVLDEICTIQPDGVINCAAFTQVDACETRQEDAYAVNAEGVRNLALACRQAGCFLYHISTDFVFDGSQTRPYVETDAPNPLSVYGMSKLKGERYIQELVRDYAIIRTAWLYGKGGPNFVSTVLRLADEHDEIRIVHDQNGCPTYTVDLARALGALLAASARGIYHVCNMGITSWHGFAERIVSLAGRSTQVVPITTEELKRPAVRPAFSVMDCSKYTSLAGAQMRPWTDALEDYIEKIG